jgi:hypothetical protein
LSFDIRHDKGSLMTRREIKKLDTRIKTIKKAAQELKELSGGIPAVDRNAVRILASVKMLEINISDVKDLV